MTTHLATHSTKPAQAKAPNSPSAAGDLPREDWWRPPSMAVLALRARAVRRLLTDAASGATTGRATGGPGVDPAKVISVLDELLLAASHARWLLKHAAEFALTAPDAATVDVRPCPVRLVDRTARRVRVVRRGDRWAVWLGEFALHEDGCFWDATPGTDPTYPRDEAIARAIQALGRLP